MMTSIPASRSVLFVLVIQASAQGTTTDLPDIGHCDTAPFEEGQTAEMHFYFGDINTSSESFLVDLMRASDAGKHLVKCYGENTTMVCRATNESFTVTNTKSELTVRILNASRHFEDRYELRGFFNGRKLPPLSCTLKVSGTLTEGDTSKAWIAGVIFGVLGIAVALAVGWCYRRERFCFRNKTVTDEEEMQNLNQTDRSTLADNIGSDPQNDVPIQGRDSTNSKQPSSVERGNKSNDFRDGRDVTDNKEQPSVGHETRSENITSGMGISDGKKQEPAIGQDRRVGKQRYGKGATSGKDQTSVGQDKESEYIRDVMDTTEKKEQAHVRHGNTPGDIRDGMDTTESKIQPPERQDRNPGNISARSGMGVTDGKKQEPATGKDRRSGKERYGKGATSSKDPASAGQDKESGYNRDGMDTIEKKEQVPVRHDNTPGDIRIDTLAAPGTACGEDALNQFPRYYFEKLTGEDEERLLLSKKYGHGSFLIKGHEDKTVVILSVNWNGTILHHRVKKHLSEFRFDGNNFASLDELTDYYKKNDIDLYDGHNICRLIKPVEEVGIDE